MAQLVLYGNWVLLVLNATLLVLIAVLLGRLVRRLNRIFMLDQLLTKICIEAFSRQHEPIWRAWAATMGSINVTVDSRRWGWNKSDPTEE